MGRGGGDAAGQRQLTGANKALSRDALTSQCSGERLSCIFFSAAMERTHSHSIFLLEEINIQPRRIPSRPRKIHNGHCL